MLSWIASKLFRTSAATLVTGGTQNYTKCFFIKIFASVEYQIFYFTKINIFFAMLVNFWLCDKCVPDTLMPKLICFPFRFSIWQTIKIQLNITSDFQFKKFSQKKWFLLIEYYKQILFRKKVQCKLKIIYLYLHHLFWQHFEFNYLS